MRQSLLNTAQNKASLRGIAKELRLELINSGQFDKISKQIVQNILNSDIFKRAKNVMLFYPLKGEINLLKLLECGDKIFIFPDAAEMNFLSARIAMIIKKINIQSRSHCRSL